MTTPGNQCRHRQSILSNSRNAIFVINQFDDGIVSRVLATRTTLAARLVSNISCLRWHGQPGLYAQAFRAICFCAFSKELGEPNFSGE